LATIRCIPSLEPSRQSRTSSFFDRNSLQELECGRKIADVDSLSSDELSLLEALTSQPELLSEEDIFRVIKLLMDFRQIHKEVKYQSK